MTAVCPATAPRIRILLLEDHPMLRRGLAALLEAEPDLQLLPAAGESRDLLASWRNAVPDIVIAALTAHLPEEFLCALRLLKREAPQCRVAVCSTLLSDEAVYQLFRAGAATVLPMDTPERQWLQAIRGVYAGKPPIPAAIARQLADRLSQPGLTAREVEVIAQVARGLRNKQIAFHLGISEGTVQRHLKNILGKLDAADRTGAAVTALRRGFIRME